MPIRLSATSLAVSLALITSACSAPMKTPDIKQNSHPTKRYEITMTIDRAPGPFDSINGYVQYQVDNGECIPLQPGSGARLAQRKSIPLALARTGNVYKGVFYGDQLQDEDYFGLGVCHWAIDSVGATLNVKKVVFSAGLSLEEIQSKKPVATYFANASYHDPKDQGGDPGDIGTPYILQHPNEFFSVTLVARGNIP